MKLLSSLRELILCVVSNRRNNILAEDFKVIVESKLLTEIFHYQNEEEILKRLSEWVSDATGSGENVANRGSDDCY